MKLNAFIVSVFLVCILSPGINLARDKVVVVPLVESQNEVNLVDRFFNSEASYTWNCPPAPNSLSFSAECPEKCIAVGGACSAKQVADWTDVVVTGGNFIKTSEDLPKYNAYECYMMALSCMDPGNPPVGYAQAVCYCQ